jgi:hypothetical protein
MQASQECLLALLEAHLLGRALMASRGFFWGAFLGALIIGPSETISDFKRKEGESKPFLYRVFTLSFAGAVFGSLLGLMFKNIGYGVLGLIIGLLFNATSLRITKVLLGIAAGGSIGLLVSYSQFELNAASLGALVIVFRALDAVLFPGQEDIQLMAERVPMDEIRYIVPFEANSKYVGADYFKDLARSEAGIFKRNPAGIGIVASLDLVVEKGLVMKPTCFSPPFLLAFDWGYCYNLFGSTPVLQGFHAHCFAYFPYSIVGFSA